MKEEDIHQDITTTWVWDSTQIDLFQFVTRLLQIMIQTTLMLMKLPENYFRQKKHGLIGIYLSRWWSYFPSTTDLQNVLKRTVICNRKGDSKTSCAYVNDAMKASCTFYFKESLETEKKLPLNLIIKNWRYKRGWAGQQNYIWVCQPWRAVHAK